MYGRPLAADRHSMSEWSEGCVALPYTGWCTSSRKPGGSHIRLEDARGDPHGLSFWDVLCSCHSQEYCCMVRVWFNLFLCLTIRQCLNFGRRAIGSSGELCTTFMRLLRGLSAPRDLIVYLVGVRRAARICPQILRSNVVRLQRVTLRHSAAFVPPHASCSIGLSDGASGLRAWSDRIAA